MSVNKVILVGNVGKDPETRYLEGGAAVSKFPLATSEVYKNKNGEKITNTEWHNIVLWRGLAEVAEKYVKKGTQLFIEGRIRTRSYSDKDGNTRYITEIIGDNMQLLGKRPDDTSGDDDTSYSRSSDKADSARQPASSESSQEESFDNLTNGSEEADDLPF